MLWVILIVKPFRAFVKRPLLLKDRRSCYTRDAASAWGEPLGLGIAHHRSVSDQGDEWPRGVTGSWRDRAGDFGVAGAVT
jgi:hypothetical protein